MLMNYLLLLLKMHLRKREYWQSRRGVVWR